MNEIKQNSKEYFYNYYKKGDDTKRLTFILFLFAFILCPIFAFTFKLIGAPIVYFYVILSASIIFPFILLLEKTIKQLNGKLPILYFIYFVIITQIVLFSLYSNKFLNNDVLYFLVSFAVLNFAIQRFLLSLIYFILTFSVLLFYSIKINYEIEILSHLNILTACIGVFYLVIFYSRNKMIDSIEDHNSYLKRIVNNLGNGVILFQNRANNLQVVDFNKTLSNLYELNKIEDIETEFIKNISEDEIYQINELVENDFFTKEYNLNNNIIHELKISKLILKKGEYFLAIIQDITQKTKENNIVLLNEKKYRNLFLRNQTGIFTLNKRGKIIDCNPAFLKIFDVKEIQNFYLFQDKEEWIKIKETLFTHEVLSNYNFTFKHMFENEIYLVVNLYFDKEQDIIEGNIIDVTDLTISSLSLQEKEKKYRLIYEESNDSILILEDDRIIDVNQKGLELFDTSFDKIVEKSIWDFTYKQSPELKKQLNEIFKELKTIKNFKFNWFFSKGNEYIETEVSIAEINIGDFTYYQCVIHDETEKRKYLYNLEQSKKTFESILENTPEGFLILKEDKILFSNKELYKIFEIKDKEFTFSEKYFGKNFNKLQELISQKKDNTGKKQEQIQFEKRDKIIDIDVTIVSIIFDEKPAEMIIFKDISYQNKLSKEQLRAELAEETSKRLVKEIEERKQVELKLETEYLRTKAIFDSSDNTLLLTLNPDLKITGFNQHSKSYFEIQTRKVLEDKIDFEKYFEQIISPIKLRYFRYLISSIRKGKSYQLQLKFINIENQKKWVELYLNPIKDLNEIVTEISLVAHDITEKKNNEREMLLSLKEKEVLLKEVHHRVKNNLQIISSIINLQSSYVEDSKTLEILEESRHRIRSMAIIHENLYQTTNFSSINFKNYSRELIRNLISSYHYNTKTKVEIIEKVELVELNLDQAIPCGLIINELITNSLKYAFKNREAGKIFLELSNKNEIITLVVGDDGVGLPSNFDINKTETLGLQLVSTLVEQIDGNIKLEKKKGIKYFITFGKQKL